MKQINFVFAFLGTAAFLGALAAPATLRAEEVGPELHIYKNGEVHIIGAEIVSRNALNVFTVQVWGQKWTAFGDYATKYESAYGEKIKMEEILSDHRLEIRGRPFRDKQTAVDAALIRDLTIKTGTPPTPSPLPSPSPLPPARESTSLLQSLKTGKESGGAIASPAPVPQAGSIVSPEPSASLPSKKLLTLDLRAGMRGGEVIILQEFLQKNNWGIPNDGPVTGYYGRVTEAAVRKFQAANNLPAVGVVGPRTRELINRQLAK